MVMDLAQKAAEANSAVEALKRESSATSRSLRITKTAVSRMTLRDEALEESPAASLKSGDSEIRMAIHFLWIAIYNCQRSSLISAI